TAPFSFLMSMETDCQMCVVEGLVACGAASRLAVVSRPLHYGRSSSAMGTAGTRRNTTALFSFLMSMEMTSPMCAVEGLAVYGAVSQLAAHLHTQHCGKATSTMQIPGISHNTTSRFDIPM